MMLLDLIFSTFALLYIISVIIAVCIIVGIFAFVGLIIYKIVKEITNGQN